MTVEINGEDYYVKFNQYALEIFTKHIDYECEATSAIYATVYAGLRGGAYVKRMDLNLDFEAVSDWVDIKLNDKKDKTVASLCEAWTETMFYKNWLQATKEMLGIEKKN